MLVNRRIARAALNAKSNILTQTRRPLFGWVGRKVGSLVVTGAAAVGLFALGAVWQSRQGHVIAEDPQSSGKNRKQIEGIWEKAKDKAENLKEELGDKADAAKNKLEKATKENVGDKAKDLAEQAKDKVEGALKSAKGKAEDVADSAKDKAEAGAAKAKAAALSAKSKVKGAAKDAEDEAEDAVDSLKDKAKSAKSKAKDAADDADGTLDNVKDKVNGVVDKLKNKAKDAYDDLTSNSKDAVDGAKKKAKKAAKDLQDSEEDTMKVAKRAAAGAISAGAVGSAGSDKVAGAAVSASKALDNALNSRNKKKKQDDDDDEDDDDDDEDDDEEEDDDDEDDDDDEEDDDDDEDDEEDQYISRRNKSAGKQTFYGITRGANKTNERPNINDYEPGSASHEGGDRRMEVSHPLANFGKLGKGLPVGRGRAVGDSKGKSSSSYDVDETAYGGREGKRSLKGDDEAGYGSKKKSHKGSSKGRVGRNGSNKDGRFEVNDNDEAEQSAEATNDHESMRRAGKLQKKKQSQKGKSRKDDDDDDDDDEDNSKLQQLKRKAQQLKKKLTKGSKKSNKSSKRRQQDDDDDDDEDQSTQRKAQREGERRASRGNTGKTPKTSQGGKYTPTHPGDVDQEFDDDENPIKHVSGLRGMRYTGDDKQLPVSHLRRHSAKEKAKNQMESMVTGGGTSANNDPLKSESARNQAKHIAAHNKAREAENVVEGGYWHKPQAANS